MFAGQYAEWVKDPHAVNRSCCSLTGQTERLILAQPGHQAGGVSVAGVAQPTLCSGATTRTLASCSQALVSFLFSQGASQPHPFPSSQRRCVRSGCRQRTCLDPGAGMKVPTQASRDTNALCSFVTRVQAIMGCSERDNIKVMLQKVPCVNCPCCHLSSVKNGCVSAINYSKMKSRPFLTGKFVTKLTSGLETQFEGFRPRSLTGSVNISLKCH